MKFVIALVSYLESLGYDTSSLRKSADGSKAIVHMQYAEILSKNLDTNANITIYDRVNPDFQALLASDEWNGNVTGTPNSFGDLAELAKYEARLTAQVTEAKTDMNNFQIEIAGEVTTAKEDLNAIVDNYQVTVNQQLDQTETDLNTRIDNIIATPTTVSEQEIIDARDGEDSLGKKIRNIDSDVSYNDYLLKDNFTKQFESSEGTVTFDNQIKKDKYKFFIRGLSQKEENNLNNVEFNALVSSLGGASDVRTLSEPAILRGFDGSPEASDTLDQDGVITRRVGKIVIDETVNLIKSGSQYPGVTRLAANQLNVGAKYNPSKGNIAYNAISEFGEHVLLASTSEPNSYRVYDAGGNESVLFVLDDAVTGLNSDSTIAEYRTWLSNNNITIYVQLDDPNFYEETIDMDLPILFESGIFKTNSILNPHITMDVGVTRELLTKDISDFMLHDDPKLSRYSTYYTSDLLPKGQPELHTDVYAQYDDLANQSDGYITKTSLGVDSTGLELLSYKFAKPNIETGEGYEKIKVGIVSGLHGDEKSPVVGLFKFMEELTKNEYGNEVLDRIKSNIDFYIIPLGCPYGWNNDTRFNANNVNINRNFDTPEWSLDQQNPGTAPASELETQYIQNWMTSNQLDYFFDFHVSNMGTGEDDHYMSWFVGNDSDSETKRAYYKTINLLSTLWSERYPYFPQNVIFGHASDYYSTAQSHKYAEYAGIKSGILEVSHYIRYTTGDIYQLGNTWAADMIGNYMFELNRKHIL